ncbi:MAG: hypothetical protein ACO3CS_16670, partial [Alphaproteobacteria bacterium]
MKGRKIRPGGPDLEKFYAAHPAPDAPPAELVYPAGKAMTLRGALGETLGWINQLTSGAVLVCAAD